MTVVSEEELNSFSIFFLDTCHQTLGDIMSLSQKEKTFIVVVLNHHVLRSDRVGACPSIPLSHMLFERINFGTSKTRDAIVVLARFRWKIHPCLPKDVNRRGLQKDKNGAMGSIWNSHRVASLLEHLRYTPLSSDDSVQEISLP